MRLNLLLKELWVVFFDIDGNFIVDCGTDKRAKKSAVYATKGKVSPDMVMDIFSNTGDKKRRTEDDKASGGK